MSLILITTDLIIVFSSLYSWKSYKDKHYFSIALLGLPVLLIGFLGLNHKVPLAYSVISLVCYSIIWNLYTWKKYKDKKFLWSTILIVISILIAIYTFYIGNIDFSLPVSDWSLNSFFVAAILLIAFVAVWFI